MRQKLDLETFDCSVILLFFLFLWLSLGFLLFVLDCKRLESVGKGTS